MVKIRKPKKSFLIYTTSLAVAGLTLGNVLTATAQLSSGPFNKEVPYQQAVPNALNAIIEQMRPVQNIEEINEWHDETAARLPEAIDDMITAVKEFEQQTLQTISAEPFEKFSTKWNAIVRQYPGLGEVEPLLVPIFEELTKGLQGPRPTQPGDVPFQSLFEFYQAMEIDNPWGASIIFRLEPLEEEILLTAIQEKLHEETIRGKKKITIIFKNTKITRNGNVIFCETIQNNKVVKREFGPYDITLIHEIVRRLKEDNGDPDLIEVMEQLALFIEETVRLAWVNGKISDEIYHIFLTGRRS